MTDSPAVEPHIRLYRGGDSFPGCSGARGAVGLISYGFERVCTLARALRLVHSLYADAAQKRDGEHGSTQYDGHGPDTDGCHVLAVRKGVTCCVQQAAADRADRCVDIITAPPGESA